MRKLLNICLLVLLLTFPAMSGAQTDSVFTPAKAHPTLQTTHHLADTLLRHMLGSPDSLVAATDSLSALTDTLAHLADTLDSLASRPSLPVIQPSPNALTSAVHYKANDSIAIDINKRKAQLYTKGVIEYDGMELKADDIQVDFNSQILSARPVTWGSMAFRNT